MALHYSVTHARARAMVQDDGMGDDLVQNLAGAAEELRRAGDTGVLVRVVELRGFGSRRLGEAAVISRGGLIAGRVLGGSVDAELTREAASLLEDPPPVGLVELSIGDRTALAAGLACGGTARLVLQGVELVPARWWEALASREPIALVTPLDGRPGRT
ncbi:MAG: XdhC family protein, partial [Acidimicrobiales bacterium]